ncbi:MAG TPA: glutathione peroxidase [Pseudomonadales bacterium]
MKKLYDFEMTAIDGQAMPLSQFEGKTVLLVNVASKCGLTPQYKGLQALYDNYKDQGLEVVGLPCNQFGGQEPGTEQEIQSFCESKYAVTFPLTSKIDVNGENRHPLYQWLAGDDAKFPGDIKWNFGKFLISSAGDVLQRFEPTVTPEDADFLKAIKSSL